MNGRTAVQVLAGRLHRYGLRRRPVLLGRPLVHWFRAVPNLGDALSPAFASWLTGHPPIWCNPNLPGKLLLVGSLIEWTRTGDVVWGTGLLADRTVPIPAGAEVVALRGPLTAERCGLDPASVTLGDPAVLTPLLLPRVADDDGRTLVITHFVDETVDLGPLGSGIDVVSAAAPVATVVDRIQRARHVVSSSLHGIICAEAYGVPATHVVLSDRVLGGTFKFRDHYAATGRTYPGAFALPEALERAAGHHERPDLSDTVAALLVSAERVRAAAGSGRPGAPPMDGSPDA